MPAELPLPRMGELVGEPFKIPFAFPLTGGGGSVSNLKESGMLGTKFDFDPPTSTPLPSSAKFEFTLPSAVVPDTAIPVLGRVNRELLGRSIVVILVEAIRSGDGAIS